MPFAVFFKSIDELADWQKANARKLSDHEKRSRVRIAVVDDEAFSAGQNLRNAG